MSVNLNKNQNIISSLKGIDNLNQRQSFQDGTEDEIASFQDDINEGTSNILMKNKELPYLENDKSITVDNDYEDDNFKVSLNLINFFEMMLNPSNFQLVTH